jgi:hypothetical protein
MTVARTWHGLARQKEPRLRGERAGRKLLRQLSLFNREKLAQPLTGNRDRFCAVVDSPATPRARNNPLAKLRDLGAHCVIAARFVASIGDRETSRAPAPLKRGRSAICRQLRSKQIRSLRERLSEQAALWREQAKALPVGDERQELLRKARQTDVAAHLDDWLTSPGASATKVSRTLAVSPARSP